MLTAEPARFVVLLVPPPQYWSVPCWLKMFSTVAFSSRFRLFPTLNRWAMKRSVWLVQGDLPRSPRPLMKTGYSTPDWMPTDVETGVPLAM